MFTRKYYSNGIRESYYYINMQVQEYMKNKIKRILMKSKDEELFLNWFENQDF